MTDVVVQAADWVAAGESVAMATVVAVRRSAPRPPGSKLAITASGQLVGAVSGGCVESSVVQAAQDVLRSGRPRLLEFGLPDDEALEIGLPCGGEIDVWIEPFLPGPFSDAAREGAPAVRVVDLDAGDELAGMEAGALEQELEPALGALVADGVDALLRSGRPGILELDGRRLFVDVTAPAPRLIIVGAVDLSRALCSVARTVGWRPFVVDPRDTFAQPSRFPDAERVLALWPRAAFAELGLDHATAVAVLTHDPKVDDQALAIALRSPASFVGALGSRHAQAARRERLLELGLDEDLLDERLSGPIGLDLGAATAEETALSVMAEIIAARNGRAGGRLTHASGRIHA